MARGVAKIHSCCGRAFPDGVKCECQKKRDLERKAAFDTKRPSARGRGYDAEWRRAREQFLNQYPWCERCLAEGKRVMATVVHHKTPHRGNMQIFWNRADWSAICEPHHNRSAQSEEKRGVK